jgi:hypothetical protein
MLCPAQILGATKSISLKRRSPPVLQAHRQPHPSLNPSQIKSMPLRLFVLDFFLEKSTLPENLLISEQRLIPGSSE